MLIQSTSKKTGEYVIWRCERVSALHWRSSSGGRSDQSPLISPAQPLSSWLSYSSLLLRHHQPFFDSCAVTRDGRRLQEPCRDALPWLRRTHSRAIAALAMAGIPDGVQALKATDEGAVGRSSSNSHTTSTKLPHASDTLFVYLLMRYVTSGLHGGAARPTRKRGALPFATAGRRGRRSRADLPRGAAYQRAPHVRSAPARCAVPRAGESMGMHGTSTCVVVGVRCAEGLPFRLACRYVNYRLQHRNQVCPLALQPDARRHRCSSQSSDAVLQLVSILRASRTVAFEGPGWQSRLARAVLRHTTCSSVALAYCDLLAAIETGWQAWRKGCAVCLQCRTGKKAQGRSWAIERGAEVSASPRGAQIVCGLWPRRLR